MRLTRQGEKVAEQESRLGGHDEELHGLLLDLTQFRHKMTAKFNGFEEDPIHNAIRNKVFKIASNQNFLSIGDKALINHQVRGNIRAFLAEHVEPQLLGGCQVNNPWMFVQTASKVWREYQILIYAYGWVLDKLTEFFAKFHNLKDYEQFNHEGDQVEAICTIGVKELEKVYNRFNMVPNFVAIFNQFMMEERESKSVPSDDIRQTMMSLEASRFDRQAEAKLVVVTKMGERLKRLLIVKRLENANKIAEARRSKDIELVRQQFMPWIIRSMENYYNNFVAQYSPQLSALDENAKMLYFIGREQERIRFYIHSQENIANYIFAFNRALIANNIADKIAKGNTVQMLIDRYELNQEDTETQREISIYWSIYSRTLQDSLERFKEQIAGYMEKEAIVVTAKTDKFADFINEVLRVSDKSLAIVKMWGGHVDLETIRVDMLRKMLSDDCVGKSKNFDIGALSLARFIDLGLREFYKNKDSPSREKALKLYKVLLEKSRFTRETHKLMAARLLDLGDFGKLNFTKILDKEKELIDLIAAECGISEVKELHDCLNNLKESQERNHEVREEVSSIMEKKKERSVFGQLLVRNDQSWVDRCNLDVPNVPIHILHTKQAVEEYFERKQKYVRFNHTEGKSLLAAEFDNKNKYKFDIRNIHVVALLLLDERRSMLWGEWKRAMAPVGSDNVKVKGVLDLLRTLAELVHSGLIRCSLNILKDPSLLQQMPETAEFTLNHNYDQIVEDTRRMGKKPQGKAPPVIQGNIFTLPVSWRKEFERLQKSLSAEGQQVEKERRFKIEARMVKVLKHAHHNKMERVPFAVLFGATQEENFKQHRVTEKLLKEILEELINKKYCERVEGQRNLFKYTA